MLFNYDVVREFELYREKMVQRAGKLLILSSPNELLNHLDEVEKLLQEVGQLPSKSMLTVLSPIITALVEEKLLKNENEDVRVAVASCLCEITRINSPDAPYEHNQMKEVFRLIVSSFKNLSDNSSQSYSKKTSILENVCQLRLCVIMLDIECDGLIVEMFQHFLKEIRDHHPESVFSFMENIMTVVLKESNDVGLELISPMLTHLKKDNQEVQPTARNLAKNVIRKCSELVKPCLLEAKSSINFSFDDYCTIISEICKETDHLKISNYKSPGELAKDVKKYGEDLVDVRIEVSLPMDDRCDGKSSRGGGEGTNQPITPSMTPNPCIESESPSKCFSQQKIICNMWEILAQKLSNCRLEDLGSFEKAADKILKTMEETTTVNISFLRTVVHDFFVSVHEYDQQRLLSMEVGFMDFQKQTFKEKNEQLEAAVSDEGLYKTKVEDSKKRLVIIETEMKRLNAEKDEMKAVLAKEEHKMSQAQSTIASLNMDLSNLEDQCLQSYKVETNIKKISKCLEIRLEKLMKLSPFSFFCNLNIQLP